MASSGIKLEKKIAERLVEKAGWGTPAKRKSSPYRGFFLKISDDGKCVTADTKEGGDLSTALIPKDVNLLNALNEKWPCKESVGYAVLNYDCRVARGDDVTDTDYVILLKYALDEAPIKKKMLIASTMDAVKKELGGLNVLKGIMKVEVSEKLSLQELMNTDKLAKETIVEWNGCGVYKDGNNYRFKDESLE